MRPFGILGALCLLALGAAQAVAGDGGILFFEQKVRPILAGHCYACHSRTAKKHKGGLVVDSREGIRKGGDSGPAVVPGKPADSLLIKAVRYSDAELRMPPKGKLPAEAVAALEKWVAMGAPDPRGDDAATATKKARQPAEGRKFWAFQPPGKHRLPAVANLSWPRGPIDRFVLAGLESKGLAPAAPAERFELVRRAYFDLIGLPPTPGQVDDFLHDSSPAAFALLVDRLLASPHFGERWGRYWLDLARYAESSGGGRSLLLKNAWRYRDYVIRAFNTDVPYDRFIAEQVAGDLLPFKTPEERRWHLIATGMWLLGPTNYERQDKPVLEMDVIDEQIDTLGKTFLGMTLGCARCHDHKFDPIPTRDYYALAGILKSTKMLVHANVSRWLEQPLPLAEAAEKAVRAHESAVARLKSRIRQARLAETRAGKLPTGPIAAADLPGIVVDDTQAKRVGSWKQSTYTGNYIGAGYLYDDRSMNGERTLTFIPSFRCSGFYEVRLAYIPHANRSDRVPVRVFHADGDDTVYVNERKPPPIAGRFVSLGRFRFEPGNQWFVMLSTDGANGHVVADAVQFVPENAGGSKGGVTAPVPLAGSTRLEAELKHLLASGPQRPVAMSVADADKTEDCQVCIRGNYHNRGARVPRGFLQVLTPAAGAPALVIPANESGRRQLAAWLASPANPLTARVMVNRIWCHLIGSGLVNTVDNFGSTGERPSHPELLDYLALRFMEQGWSVKRLIREIMLSRTYQQSTRGGSGAALDPENRLLWRMNRRRLDAEAIRDAMLAVSGELESTMGGSTIKKDAVAERDYRFEDSRRSVYTPVFRNKLLELLEVFDFADPNICLGRRNVSTVATQALYLMNSPFVMGRARQAARRLLAIPGQENEVRLDRAYRLSLGRPPTAGERTLMLGFLASAGNERSQETWERLLQTLFASIDFRYVN